VRPKQAGLHDNRPTLRELAGDLAGKARGRVQREYGAALTGFALEADAAAAAALTADPRVAYVAEDGWVEVAGQAAPPSWGLDRIDQREGALDGYYDYVADGATVDVYVVDTGIRSTHVNFEGRVDLGRSFDAVEDGNGTEDCHGHGTHVAGIVGGASYGVAKAVTLHPVRVLDCTGRGTVSQIVAGVDWITAQYSSTTTTDGGGTGGGTKGGGGGGKGGGKNGVGTWDTSFGKAGGSASTASTGTPAVVNMSLATSWTQALDDAVARSIDAGIVYVIAAGNGSEDACYVSPARVPAAITVGATNPDDTTLASSNFGACLDLWAPGYAVVSSFNRSDSDSLAMSGTSMAAPHVAGTAALLLSVNPELTPAEVASLIAAGSTGGAVAAAGSTDRLLFAPFSGWGVDMAPVAELTASCSNGSCKLSAAPSTDDRGLIGFAWDLGNGKTAAGEAVSVKYGRNAPAQVLVALTVTDTVGQTTTIERWVNTQF
jgi:serine protease